MLVTTRVIQAGEPITVDYQWVLEDGDTPIECECGEQQCRGIIQHREGSIASSSTGPELIWKGKGGFSIYSPSYRSHSSRSSHSEEDDNYDDDEGSDSHDAEAEEVPRTVSHRRGSSNQRNSRGSRGRYQQQTREEQNEQSSESGETDRLCRQYQQQEQYRQRISEQLQQQPTPFQSVTKERRSRRSSQAAPQYSSSEVHRTPAQHTDQHIPADDRRESRPPPVELHTPQPARGEREEGAGGRPRYPAGMGRVWCWWGQQCRTASRTSPVGSRTRDRRLST